MKTNNEVDTFGNESAKAVMQWRQYSVNTNIASLAALLYSQIGSEQYWAAYTPSTRSWTFSVAPGRMLSVLILNSRYIKFLAQDQLSTYY